MANPWHMARVASRRSLPKQRPLYPYAIGEFVSRESGAACCGCGYHVCSCRQECEVDTEDGSCAHCIAVKIQGAMESKADPAGSFSEQKNEPRSLSQRMAEAGFRRRPTCRSLPKDE